jgi:hypothetical protein
MFVFPKALITCTKLNGCLNFKEWRSIAHLILNNDSYYLESNFVVLHSVSKLVLQNLKVAILEFLTEVHPLLPPYWYKLDGDDVGSLAFLFGLAQEKLEALFLWAGIFKQAKTGTTPIPMEHALLMRCCPLIHTILKVWSLHHVRLLMIQGWSLERKRKRRLYFLHTSISYTWCTNRGTHEYSFYIISSEP